MTTKTKMTSDYDPLIGVGVGFQRIRRITGYLVGTTDRWNQAKRAELSERTKHPITLASAD